MQRGFSTGKDELSNLSAARTGPAVLDATGKYNEPKFLEQVQMMVENAATKAKIKPDMLKYIMSCDNVIRF